MHRRIVTPVAVAAALSLLAGMPCTSAAAPTAPSGAGGLIRAPAPAGTPVPVRTSGERHSAAVSAEFPADPHAFTRTHRGPVRPVKRGLAHLLLQRPVRVTPVRPRPGPRASGPPVWPGALDPAKAPKNVGAVVVAYMARNKTTTPAPTPTPVPLFRQRRIAPSGARRASAIDVNSQNVTGINHWWSYEEGPIPGVGRWMVNAYSGNLIVQADDMDVPHRGIDLAFRRTYNSFSRHDFAGNDGATEIGQYGSGWTNTFDAHLSTNGCPNTGYSWAGFYGFSVHDIDGARYDYCFDASGRLVAPPGMQGTSLVANADGGSFYWTKKSGTQYTFYSPYYGGTSAAYSGRIYRISGRNQNSYLQFTYAWSPDASSSANLTNIYAATDNGGSQATLTFANFNGQVLLSQLTRPDGAAITYDYDANGQLIAVSKPAPNTSGVPTVETYNGYQSALMVAGPRWNAGGQNDGGYVAFFMDETTTAQVDGIEWAGVMNFLPNDGTATLLQPAVATGPIVYRWETVGVAPTYTSFSDTDGHGQVQYVDTAGRPTVRQVYTGSQWLQTSLGWDPANDLTSETDPRGFETDYAYDSAGNTIAAAEPPTATSQGTFRPTRLYDYDATNNMVAFCNETGTHTAGADWTATPATSDSLCSTVAANVAHWHATYTNPSYEPFGELTSMTTPLGYTHHFSYVASQQAGADYGLPTSVTGDAFPQIDGTTISPTHGFWYDAQGAVRCYSDGQGVTVVTVDTLGRTTMVADGDDSSANGVSTCGKTGGQPGWNTETTFSYNPDGSLQSSQSPPERGVGVSTGFAYDLDGDVISETRHFGCTAAPSCTAGTTTKWYDGADRLVEVGLPHDATDYYASPWLTRYAYDLTLGGYVALAGSTFHAAGNIYKTQEWIAQTQGGNPTWLDLRGSAFDALDRETTKYTFSPSSNTTLRTATRAYDTSAGTYGQLAYVIDPLGETTTYTYDSQERAVDVKFTGDGGSTPERWFTYDPQGRIAAATGAVYGTETMQYDLDDRLVEIDEPTSGSLTSPARLTYHYYADGERKELNVASAALSTSVSYAYRVDGKRTRVALANGQGTFQTIYSDGGRPTSRSDPFTGTVMPNPQAPVNPGTVYPPTTWSYDTTGQLAMLALPHTFSYQSINHDAEGTVVGWTGSSSYSGATTMQFTTTVRGENVRQVLSAPTAVLYTAQIANGALVANPPAAPAGFQPNGPFSAVAEPTNAVVRSTTQEQWTANPDPEGPRWEDCGPQTTTNDYDAASRLVSKTQTMTITGPQADCQFDTGPTVIRRYSYDAENHHTATAIDDNGVVSDPIVWSPTGHAYKAGSYNLHYDGDQLLFVTDQNGALIEQKIETLGNVSNGALTVIDRGVAGQWVSTHNASVYGSIWLGATIYRNKSGAYTLPSVFCGSAGGGNGPCSQPPQQPVGPAKPGNFEYDRVEGFQYNGLTFQGVRAVETSSGQWTTPDAYAGDVHDPMSQKPFMWDRNNPYHYADPTGFFATMNGWDGIIHCPYCHFIGKGGKRRGGNKTTPEWLKNLGEWIGDKIKHPIEQPAPNRMPKGPDNHAVEVHHVDQDPKKPTIMTRTEHRLGGNYQKNHQNTGQDPSRVTPQQRTQDRKDFLDAFKEWVSEHLPH